MNVTLRRSAITAALSLAIAAGMAPVSNSWALSKSLPQVAATGAVANPFVGADGKADVIIVLDGEPAVFAYSRALASGGSGMMSMKAAGTASRAARDQLAAKQETFMAQLSAKGIAVTELYRVQRALNGVAVRMAAADMAKVRKMAGVSRVEFLPIQEPATSTSVPFIGAPSVWEGTPLGTLAAKGEGIRIGIIDTGLDYQHPDFGGSGLLADYQANDRTTIGDTISGNPIFPTAKVVGGWDFAGDAYTAGNAPTPDPDPMDCNGHGSHVAGITAGYGVKADGTTYTGAWDTAADYSGLKIGPGVAPQAQLYALRVFGCGGSTSLTTDAIDWATDPNNDGDLSDRLDVINMSLGSNFGASYDSSAVAADNATLSGMIVVASAGNSGDTFFISGSPGSGTKVISTASSLDSGLPGPLGVNAPASVTGIKSTGSASFGTVPPVAGLTEDIVRVDDGDTTGTGGTINDGCQTPYVNAAAVSGKIAFVDRGSCGFKLKAYNAQLNGAIGVIIGNVATSSNPSVAPGMADDITVPAVTIPVVSLNLADANALRTAYASATVNVTMFTGADTASSFTSRGPRGGDGGILLKPDLSAPGSSITSVQTGVTCTAAASGCLTPNASGYVAAGASLVLSGTSMASPHAAGAMALLRQLNPGGSVEQLKALAINTASHDVGVGPNHTGPFYGAARVGSGRIDPADAATTKVIAYNDDAPGAVSVTFDSELVAGATATHNVRIANGTAIIQNVTLSLDTVVDAPGVAFSIVGPTSISVPASGSTVVQIQLTADTDLMTRSRDSTIAATQSVPSPFNSLGAQPRHYLAEESALLKVSKNSSELARLPVYVAHRPHATLQAPATNPPGSPATGTITLPLTGQGVCTGTVSGGTCTATLATDESSLVSPFELQVVGTQVPGNPGFADIRYAGVNYDATIDEYYFGIATFGKWSSPSSASVNICIDNNNDGTYDKVLFNSDGGSITRILGGTSSSQDTFFSFIYNQSAGTVGVVDYLNAASASTVDSALLDNNVMVIGGDSASLGLASGGATFHYAIAVCPWFSALCADIDTYPTQCTGASYSEIPGPFVYNGAAKGISSSGGVGSQPVLIGEATGGTISVDYNEANMAANGSSGLLLLHHHNRSTNSAQVVVMDDLFNDRFEGN